MSTQHPIVAITGSTGSGRSTIKNAFREIFLRENIQAQYVTGDSFRRYDQKDMRAEVVRAEQEGKSFSHFGPEANLFTELEELFRIYGESGNGKIRRYVHKGNEDVLQQPAGTFTPWSDITSDSDLMFYEGLHGGVVARSWTRRRMSPSHNPRVIQERRNPSRRRCRAICGFADWCRAGSQPGMDSENTSRQ